MPYLPDGNLGVRRRLASGAHHGQRHLGCAVLENALADLVERPPLEVNPYADSLHYYVDVTWSRDRVPGAFFSSSNFLHFSQTVDQWAAEDPDVLQYYGGRSLLVQSHGQSIMAYLQARCERPGLYLMDEPETALSPGSQLALVRLLHNAATDGNTQFIIATHSPILLACPGATIYSFDHAPVRRVQYADVPLVRMYRDFLADPELSLGAAANPSAVSGTC